jgi:hypothetical protein
LPGARLRAPGCPALACPALECLALECLAPEEQAPEWPAFGCQAFGRRAFECSAKAITGAVECVTEPVTMPETPVSASMFF